MKFDVVLDSCFVRSLAEGSLSIIEKDGFAFDFDFDSWYYQRYGKWRPDFQPSENMAQQTHPGHNAYVRQILETVYFLPMLYTRDDQRMGAIGLLLQRQPEFGRGFYRRVGTTNMWSSFSKINRQDFEVDAWYYQGRFTEEDFLDRDGKGGYEVAII